MTKITPQPPWLSVIAEHIPPRLKTLRTDIVGGQWVCWRAMWEATRRKWTKPPIKATDGNAASHSNPQTWGTYEQALATYHAGYANGIGVVLHKNGIVGIDLDHCVDPTTGVIGRWASTVVQQLNSYTEITVSGTGLRVFVEGRLPGKGHKKTSIELYDNERYFTVSGHHLNGTPPTIEPRQEALLAIVATYFPGKQTSQGSTTTALTSANPPLDDDKLISQALASEKFAILWMGDIDRWAADRLAQASDGEVIDTSHSAADLALCSLLARFTQDIEQIDRLFRRSQLCRNKWLDREEYRAWTITRALAQGRAPHATPPDPWEGLHTVRLPSRARSARLRSRQFWIPKRGESHG
jgi:putative DNA primase/helicase